VGRGSALVLIAAVWLAAALASGLVLSRAAAAQSLDPALLRLAEQSGCTGGPLAYVPGYFAAGDAGSGIFWCRRGEAYAEQGRVVIVVMDRHQVRRLGCPSVIVAINEPSALRVVREPPLPLSAFVHRQEPWRTGPAGRHTSGPIVDATDGDVGEQWVCHDGEWLVRVYH
jgi:hypothetical protein